MSQDHVPAEIILQAPPELPSAGSPGLLARLLPVVMSVAGMGVMGMAFVSGTVTRSPMFLAFPMMMLVSTAVTVLTGRAHRQGDSVDSVRFGYLRYLSRTRETVAELAATQCSSLRTDHPEPHALWTLIGGPLMWRRRAADLDFCSVRIGVGAQPLSARLVAPQAYSPDPVTATALRRFIAIHSTIVAPIAIGLRGRDRVTIDGDVPSARGLLRAMVCQLAVLHPPDQLLIVGVVSERSQVHWEWLKWLPHNGHPAAVDATGPVRMVFRSLAEARLALAGARRGQVIVVADVDEPAGEIAGATLLEVGTGCRGDALAIRHLALPSLCFDGLDDADALVCARRLARYRDGAIPAGDESDGWPGLIGLAGVGGLDPTALWRGPNSHGRLCVPLGTTVEGIPAELDIKEAAEDGMGPHGLCIGATGSGKSELLRTIALGMIARNSSEVLNLLLIDFKGGATFLDFARAPHVAAVITNLADEAPLVARMRDALAGEMNRRQRLLRAAGCVSVTAYERVRATGTPLTALPTLLVIVDEFSELLSQHPDFADLFVAIGRLGRSLGIHLLLASQRLDEGRLRGLEAHLSYRICLKTLSAGESRTVLGTLDAYELPNTPGAGFLRAGGGELLRFDAAFVSGPLPGGPARDEPSRPLPSVQQFGTEPAGTVRRPTETPTSVAPTVLQAVLDRVSGHGPPAHPVWLPPLGPAPALHTLLRDAAATPAPLTVPIGVVDRPFEQCRTPLLVDLSGAAGNVAVVGAPRSGKSTALRTLITALAARHEPRQVQFYCLDFGGGALTSVGVLPHVGAVAGRAEPRLVGRIVAECESVVRSREELFGRHRIGSIAEYRQRRDVSDGDPFGDVFLVIDGWASLRHEFEALEASIAALAVQGLSFGVHVVLSASRWGEIRPSLKDQIGTRIELRLGDPADSDLDRKAAQLVPHDKPGRGLTRDALQMVIASPVAAVHHSESSAPPIPLLPNRISHDAVVRAAGAELSARIILGLDERRLGSVAIDFAEHSHLLVLGDNGCGKTATLRTLCREIVRTSTAAQAQLLIVDFRRSLLGVVESEHLGGYAMSTIGLKEQLPRLLDLLHRRMPPADASQEQLRARSWWSGPEVYVVVDDYDLVATPAGNALAPIVEYLPYAPDLGLHLIVARRSGGAERALFEPLLAALRDLGCMALTMSDGPGGSAPLNPARPTRLPPGRGVLITRAGEEQLVQVGWSAP